MTLPRSPALGAREVRGQGAEDPAIARASVDARAIEPEFFLRLGPDRPRVFWQRRDAWRAGVGAAWTLEVHAHEDRRNGDGPTATEGRVERVVLDDPRERFSEVQRRARELHRATLDAGETEPLRLHGGFAFHPDPRTSAAWSGLPTTRFTVPALELDHGPGGTRLTTSVPVLQDEDPRDATDRAQRTAKQAAAELGEVVPEPLPEPSTPTVVDEGDRSRWEEAVHEALDAIRDGQLSKVVLARTLDVDVPAEPDPILALRALRHQNPGTNLFLHEPAPGSAFLGAAPELIGDVRGRVFHASAVAGSIRRGEDPEEDERLARELLASEKDRAEHAFVVRSMRRRLADLTGHVEVGRETALLRLSRIQHLERGLYARLGPDQHLLDLVEALHPTPAVCGTPREAARAFLRDVEGFERGWYAGPVGWFDATGAGAFAPALRCAVLQGSRWRLFAGAGIVEGSDPAAEFEETRVKLEPVLRALGGQEVD